MKSRSRDGLAANGLLGKVRFFLGGGGGGGEGWGILLFFPKESVGPPSRFH